MSLNSFVCCCGRLLIRLFVVVNICLFIPVPQPRCILAVHMGTDMSNFLGFVSMEEDRSTFFTCKFIFFSTGRRSKTKEKEASLEMDVRMYHTVSTCTKIIK